MLVFIHGHGSSFSRPSICADICCLIMLRVDNVMRRLQHHLHHDVTTLMTTQPTATAHVPVAGSLNRTGPAPTSTSSSPTTASSYILIITIFDIMSSPVPTKDCHCMPATPRLQFSVPRLSGQAPLLFPRVHQLLHFSWAASGL